MYNHNKAQQSKNRAHISWDILYTWVNTDSANVVLPVSTKPLPKPMLINYQEGLMAFTWGE